MRDALGNFNPRSGGSGITESQHQTLDTLVHEIDENSFDEVTRSGGRVMQIITWDSPAKLLKIREEAVTRDSLGRVTQYQAIQYDGVGAVKETMTETYTRVCGRVTSVLRVRVPLCPSTLEKLRSSTR